MAARKLPIILMVVLAFSIGLTATRVGMAPAQAAIGDSVVLAWNQQLLDTFKEARTGPTVAARALAVVHTAIYDAWAAYDPVAVGTRLGGNLRQPAADRTLDNKNRAVSFAAYAALVDLFPARQGIYSQQMTDLGYAVDGSDTSTAAMIGAAAAQAVLDWRHHDGANQLADEPGTPIPLDGSEPKPYSDYTGYKPKNSWNTPADTLDPDHWQPLCVLTDTGIANGMPRTPPAGNNCDAPTYKVQTYLTPFWAKVTPFALTRPDQFRPTGRLHLSGAGREAQRQVRR